MDKASVHSEEDTLAPMQTVQPPRGPAGGARRGTLMGPRKSIAVGLLGRSSVWTLGRKSKAQDVKLENTYRMQPKDEERLMSYRLRPTIQEALEECLASYSYSEATAGKKVCEVAQIIRDRVKDAGFLRYKLVVQVQLLQRRQTCQSPSAAGLSGRRKSATPVWR
ncbi:hypothetical protein BOX15_Mlig000961g1 [Macrostomum lignano]|uniref:Uncharacterized protein n=1 Tax=Macrostomum lignano TaxID=282301 RepID=A0A267FAU4_9PLAT|nr:hypothetical protein BOX15_Mlig000961g1 [Macrostomum lignano]